MLGASLSRYARAMADRRFEEDSRMLRETYTRYLADYSRRAGVDATADDFMPKVQEFVQDRMVETMHGLSWLDKQRYGGRYRALAAETVMAAWEYQDGLKRQRAQIVSNEIASEQINAVHTGEITWEEARANIAGRVQNPVFRDQALQRVAASERSRGLETEALDFQTAIDERFELQQRGLASRVGGGLRRLEETGEVDDDVLNAVGAFEGMKAYQTLAENQYRRNQTLRAAQGQLLLAQNEIQLINGENYEDGLARVQEASGKWSEWESGDSEIDEIFLQDLQDLAAVGKNRLLGHYFPDQAAPQAEQFHKTGDLQAYYRDIQLLAETSLADTLTEQELISDRMAQARQKWDKVQGLRANAALVTEEQSLREQLQTLERDTVEPQAFLEQAEAELEGLGQTVLDSLPLNEQEAFQGTVERARTSLRASINQAYLGKVDQVAATAAQEMFEPLENGVANGTVVLEDALERIQTVVEPLAKSLQPEVAKNMRLALLSADQQRAIRDELVNPAASIGGAHPTLEGTALGFMRSLQDAPPELFQEMTAAARENYPRDATWHRNEMKQEVVLWSALSEMYFLRTGGDLADDLAGEAKGVFNAFTTWKNDEGELLFPQLEEFWEDVLEGQTAQANFVQAIELVTGQNPLALYGAPYDELRKETRDRNYEIAYRQAQRAKNAQREERRAFVARRMAEFETQIYNGEFDPTQERPGWMLSSQWGVLEGKYLQEQERLALNDLYVRTGLVDASTERGRRMLNAVWNTERGRDKLLDQDPGVQRQAAETLGRLAQSGRLPSHAKTLVNGMLESTHPAVVTAGLRAAAMVADASTEAFERDLGDWDSVVADFRAERLRTASHDANNELALQWAVGQHMERRLPEFQGLDDIRIAAIDEQIAEYDFESGWFGFGAAWDDFFEGDVNPDDRVNTVIQNMVRAAARRRMNQAPSEAVKSAFRQVAQHVGPNAIGQEVWTIRPLRVEEIGDTLLADQRVRDELKWILAGSPESREGGVDPLVEAQALSADYWLQREATRPNPQTLDTNAFRLHYDATGDETYVDSGRLIYFNRPQPNVNRETFQQQLQDGENPTPPPSMSQDEIIEDVNLNVPQDELEELFREYDERAET